jgi:hypothetical protein
VGGVVFFIFSPQNTQTSKLSPGRHAASHSQPPARHVPWQAAYHGARSCGCASTAARAVCLAQSAASSPRMGQIWGRMWGRNGAADMGPPQGASLRQAAGGVGGWGYTQARQQREHRDQRAGQEQAGKERSKRRRGKGFRVLQRLTLRQGFTGPPVATPLLLLPPRLQQQPRAQAGQPRAAAFSRSTAEAP